MSEPQGHYGYEPAQPNPYVQQQGNPYDQPPPAYFPQVVSYPYAPQLPDHPQSTVVFVLGLLSLFFGGITGPFALFMGRSARREIASRPGVYRDGGLLTAGWVMGIIGTVYLGFMVLFIVGYVIFALVIFGAMAASAP